MANIEERKNADGSTTFRIRVFMGNKPDGSKDIRRDSFTPPKEMRLAEARKEAKKRAVIFEDELKSGLIVYGGKTPFGDYAREWIENAQLSIKTKERYWELFKRIDVAIGHIPLEKLQAHHLEAFYKNLREPGLNKRGEYATTSKLEDILKSRKISRVKVAEKAGISHVTVNAAARGKQVKVDSAMKIAEALQLPVEQVFEIHKSTLTLSEDTIRDYHTLIRTILGKAKKTRLILFNVAAEQVTAPKVRKKEVEYLDDNEAYEFMQCLEKEPDIRKKTALTLLIYTGARRGELCGLTWPNIREEKQQISVRETLQYTAETGIFEAPTKTESSERDIDVSEPVFALLREYKKWWLKQKTIFGEEWQDKDERLFIRHDGKPLHPDTINNWLNEFTKRNGLKHITPHSLRHTFATLQLVNGVDVRTLQARTGHSQASTLLNTYSHVVESAKKGAADILGQTLRGHTTNRG